MEREDDAREDKPQKRRGFGAITAAVVGLPVGLTIVALPFVATALTRKCLPFIPSSTFQVESIVAACRGRRRLVDLGAGDGRIAIAVARCHGIPCDGYEINPWLVWMARVQSWRAGTSTLTQFHIKDLFAADLSAADTISVFGVAELMEDIEQKLQRDARLGSRIITCNFPLPSHRPSAVYRKASEAVFVYDYPDHGVLLDSQMSTTRNNN